VTFLGGLGDRLREGLRRSQEHLANGLRTVLEPERPIGEALYAELEELLIAADLGATLAADFTNRAREEVMFGTVTRADQLRPVFRRFLADTLQSAAQPLNLDHRPAVVLMLGVNGAGPPSSPPPSRDRTGGFSSRPPTRSAPRRSSSSSAGASGSASR